MTERENLLRTVRFERPDYIPMVFHINGACWHHYPQGALEELMSSHPSLFPNFEGSSRRTELSYDQTARAGQLFRDAWGCVWETKDDGITGCVTHHPLEDWEALPNFVPLDPEETTGSGPAHWDRVAAGYEKDRAAGRMARGGLPHGHTFLRLIYLRGYENVIYDMADGDQRLHELIRLVEAFNLAIVHRYVGLGVEWMGYAEDLGMQVGPMLSVAHFRRYIKPTYERLMAPAREAGCIIHMHSDGDVRDLAEDLIDGGVEVINLQDLVNGVDWIAAHLAGRVCIDLDVDRQNVTRFGTPAQIDALIREEVEVLGSRQGGLMMIHGLYPGVPLDNVKALMDAMERYATYYS